MRVAYWSPFPPDPTGIADFSFDLLTQLARKVEITAIVRDPDVGRSVPPGVRVEPASNYRPERFDWDMYQIGNHVSFHGYIHAHALKRPGITVLHDPALVDLYSELLGGMTNRIFAEEVAYNLGNRQKMPVVSTERGEEPDRLALLMSRRLVDASALTLVHSVGVRDAMRERWPGVNVEQVPLATPVLELTDRPQHAPAVFGIFGGLSRQKRVLIGLRAFLSARHRHPDIRLVIAGRSDEPNLVRTIKQIVAVEAPPGSVECHFDVELTEFEALLQSTDVVIIQRWPTAGETSASLMRSFGAGRAVIASDLLQNREFDPEFCQLISVEPTNEHDQLTGLIGAIATDPEGVRQAGRKAREFIRESSTPELVADRYLHLLRTLNRSRPSISTALTLRDRPVPQVNAIASWASTTGLTEAARRATLALLDTGADVAIEDFDFQWAPRDTGRFPKRFSGLPKGRPFPVDLCFLNVNELQMMSDDYLRTPNHYVIGWWYWELPSIPSHIQKQLKRVNEIWVASEFVRDSFAQYTRAPIEVLPCVVEPQASRTTSLEDFGVPEGRCVFLFNFDANSTLARKNPWGVIDAYRRAFSVAERRTSTHLVVKTINLHGLDEARTVLTEAVSSVDGTLIDEELSSGEMAALISGCDVYVSLHRAEGFGLGLAEAMYFGRPVIATAYSGNVDFTHSHNSCPVGYTLRPVSVGELRFNPYSEYIYEPGLLWAEPDLEQAARWMRLLADHPDLRDRIGRAGQDTVRDHMSSAVVGRTIRTKLEGVARRLASTSQ